MSRPRSLVTGGSGSIGSQIATRLVRDGYETHFTYRTPNSEVDSLTDRGAIGVEIDLLHPDLSLLPEKIDILVNCAGISEVFTLAESVSRQVWDDTLAINLTAPMLLSQRYLPGMRAREWGRIVNIGSIYSVVGSRLNSAYNVSKHGLSGLTKSIAKEYGEFGITANEVLPGAVSSRMMLAVAERKARETGCSATEYLAQVAASAPDGRMASPDAVAAAVMYLVSRDADHVNGASMVIDGGLTC